ncbi:MAG: recombinase family protein, partial [Lachnospiraceae bacterium]|nr:recombinase family protein [Lachnospiraceae bacterium]
MNIIRIRRKRDRHKKRVAAYCRVSTLLGEQEDSFEIQKAYYQSYIQAHDDWEFAGIYSDEKSGTKAKNRPGFQSMIDDALDEKVDYILVKSISRFSRNIVDCQHYAKILQGNGVDVWFEKENLHASDPACFMMFSFLSAIAQDESRMISENVRWAYRERFKRGEYNLGNNRILGYDSVDGKLVPNADAEAIRLIY